MAVIISDNWVGLSGTPVGRTPNVTDNGNTWAVPTGEDATFSNYGFDTPNALGISGFGASATLANALVIDTGIADFVWDGVAWAKSIITDSHSDTGCAGRFSDEDTGIVVAISATANAFRIVKWNAGTRTVLASTSVTISLSTQYRIRAVFNGSSIDAELFSAGGASLATVSTTDSLNSTVTTHGCFFGRTNSGNQRNLSVEISEISLGSRADSNGFDVFADSTDTTIGNWTVKAGTASSETTRTIQSIRRVAGGTEVRIRLANGNRILSTDSVLVSNTTAGVTDESATNESKQTANAIVYELANGGTVALNFASAPTVGITAAGIFEYTNAVNITGQTYTLGTNEEQYRLTVQKDPAWGDHDFGDAEVVYPYTPAENESLVANVWLPDPTTRANNTAYVIGDIIDADGGSNYWRCTTAGTSGGSPPVFNKASSPVSDGGVTWTFLERANGQDNRSLIQHTVYAVCSGSALRGQTKLAPSYMAGADKTWHDISDINTSLLPGDTISGANPATAEALVKYPWYDNSINTWVMRTPGVNYPTYGQFLQGTWQSAVRAAFSDALYTDTLIEYMVQRGIEQKGIREVGGDWESDGGHSQARISMAIFAGGILEQGEAWWNALKQNANATTDWYGTEFATQLTYLTQSQIDTVVDSEFQYSAAAAVGVGKTFYDPASAPSTFDSDTPAVAAFPASVRDSWLHVPEWGVRTEQDFTRNTPLWSKNDVENYYRTTQGREWSYLCYMIEALGIREAVDAPLFFDYTRRYQYIQGPDNADASWDDQDLWVLFEADEPAFAFTASAVIVGGTWYIDLNFNRYATQTDANIASQFGCSGSISLSNADQTGPRTFRVQASADPRGETITYTESGTAANRVVDSGDNELPTASTATVIGTQELQLTINPTTTPTIVASGGKLDFGKVANGTLAARSIEIENTGDATLKLDLNTATITSTDVVNYFAKGSGSWNDDEDVAPDGTLQLAVTFNAAAATLSPGTYTAVLSIPSNDADSPFTLNLSATVLEVGPSTKGNWGINTAIKIGV